MPLHVEQRGSGPPLVLLHGFTQTCRLWGPFGDLLARDHTLLAVDLPGHGGSAGVQADLPATATLVHQAVIDTIGTATCDLIGYSLGARVALHVALGTQLALGSLVLIGVTGGIEDAGERLRRLESDRAMADALEASGDVGAFVEDWLRGPMFARLAGAADAEERGRNSAAGLAGSLRSSGTGTQLPLWGDLPRLDVPLLALAGADDARFAAHALRMAALAPHAVATLVPGGGHAVHLAQPQAAWRLVHHWLARPHKDEADGKQHADSQLEA